MPEATYHFPRGFLWGTATAAHQVEGNNTNNQWWKWEEDGHTDGRSGLACDWWGGRWKEDLDRAAGQEVNASVAFPLLDDDFARFKAPGGEFLYVFEECRHFFFNKPVSRFPRSRGFNLLGRYGIKIPTPISWQSLSAFFASRSGPNYCNRIRGSESARSKSAIRFPATRRTVPMSSAVTTKNSSCAKSASTTV